MKVRKRLDRTARKGQTNEKKFDDLDQQNPQNETDIIMLDEPEKPLKSITTKAKDIILYCILLVLIFSLLTEVGRQIDSKNNEKTLNSQRSLKPSRNIQTDEFTGAILDEVDANKHNYEGSNPVISLDLDTGDGLPTEDYLQSSKYLQSLDYSAFTVVEIPYYKPGHVKKGPTKQDIRYINSKILPQKITPAWDTPKKGEMYELWVYLSEFPLLNASKIKVKPAYHGTSNEHNVQLKFPTKRLMRMWKKEYVYFHIYLTKDKAPPSDILNCVSLQSSIHTIHKIPTTKIVHGDVSQSFPLAITPIVSISVIFPTEIIDYPYVSDTLKQYLTIDPLNRRDFTGAIAMYYPIVYVNFDVAQVSSFRPFDGTKFERKDQFIDAELKFNGRYSGFQIYLGTVKIFEAVSRFVGLFENFATRYGIEVFCKGLKDIEKIVYALMV